MGNPNDRYSVLPPPIRSPLFDVSGEGSITPVWKRHLIEVASKAGRSMVWRGKWTETLRYAINDVVSDESGIWCALAENANQRPGTDKDVWDRITAGGGGALIEFETDGTLNGSQVLLNLISGANISLFDDGLGGVSISTTSGVGPGNEPGATHNFLTAYNSTTGAFSKAQPVEADVVNLVADLALKAPLASPTFTGDPKAPTPSPGDNDTSIATTAFVTAAVGPGGSGAYFAWGGDGSDGAAVFNGSSTVLGLVPSASVYTLVRDIVCTDITVNSGVTLITANYAVFATGTATINGTIHNDGGTASNGQTATSATGGTGGNVGVRTSSPGGNDGHYNRLINPVAGTAGGNGGTAAGTQAAAATAGTGVSNTPLDGTGAAGATGSSGGKGGTGTSGAGGAVRTGATGGAAFASVSWQTGRTAAVAASGIAFNAVTPHFVQASNAGNGGAPGGGGGGGDGTNSGGGGGGGGGEGGSGGVCAIFAHTISIGATGIVRANGGRGGNGGNGRTQTVGNVGGGGGGAGGSGGVGGIVWLIYHRYTNAGTVQANGGTGGTGGTKGSPAGTGTDDATGGANGPTGPAGNVVTIPC
jgi:hypothetical protein